MLYSCRFTSISLRRYILSTIASYLACRSHHYLSSQSSASEYSIPTPKTPQKSCTRDDHLRIQILFFQAGWTKDEIALQLNLSIRQVHYALHHRLTPQESRTGRRPLLGPTERKQLVDWVYANGKNRRTP